VRWVSSPDWSSVADVGGCLSRLIVPVQPVLAAALIVEHVPELAAATS